MITQSQTYELPRLNKRILKRKYNMAKTMLQKKTKAYSRKAKSKSLAVIRRQYFITHAKADLQLAVQRNEDIFIATLIAIAVISYSFALTAFELLLLFMNTAYAAAEISGFSMIIMVGIAGSVLAVLSGWIAAFALNTVSIAIMDGANLKKNRSVRSTFRRGLQHATRVANSWLMLAALAFGPIVAAAVPAYLYVTISGMSLKELIDIVPIAAATAGAWVLSTLIQYSLVPHVALFETDTPLRGTFTRSRQLVKRRGRLFLASLYVLVTVALFAGYKVAAFVEKLIGLNNAVLFTVEALLALLLINCITLMLYRKRKLARKN